MKPRIEKKVSKKLAAILGSLIGAVWIDSEYCIYKPFHCRRGERLSGNHERGNRNTRVCVNHMPVIGGDPDYWGEGSDPSTVHDVAIDVFSWTFFDLGPEDEYGCSGYPVVTEKMTGAWLIKKAHEYLLLKH